MGEGSKRCKLLGIKSYKDLLDNMGSTSYNQPREHIQKQRHYFANKGSSTQGYGFSSGHVWM